ncbi:MAG: ubiquitin-activating E1 FCCH domain-containing protein [Gammaproteobacteria bacterium]
MNIEIPRRAGLDRTLTYRRSPTVKRAITAISKADPGKVTAPGHGFLSGATVFITRLKGMEQGANRAYTVAVLDADNFTIGIDTSAYDPYVSGGVADNGKPVDLTGYTARMQFRAKETDASPALDLTTSNGGVFLGGTAGTIRFVITAAQAIALTLTQGVHEFDLIDSAGAVRKFFEGAFTR